MSRRNGSGFGRANDRWSLHHQRLVVVGNPGLGRWVFGLPWLGFGVYFLVRYLVLGIVEYVRAGDIAGIFEGTLGWLFILVFFGGIFVVPGWALVFLRRRVVVDRARMLVEELTDLRVFSWGGRHPLEGFVGVRIGDGRADSADGGPQGVLHEVRLVAPDGGHDVIVSLMQDAAEADRLAAALVELSGLRLLESTEQPRRKARKVSSA